MTLKLRGLIPGLGMLLALAAGGQEACLAGSLQDGSLARLEVEIRDSSTQKLIPARVYLVDSGGNLKAPEGVITYQKHKEHHFISPGSFEIQLAPGPYSLTIERGPEYRSWQAFFTLKEGEILRKQASLTRWISMNSMGWYSADLHNHRKLEEMPALLLAEDLNLAPTLTDWIWEDKPASNPPATSESIRQVDRDHVFSVLDKEVERLEWGPGAVDLLGLKLTIPFEGDRLFPPNDRFCRQAHAQGAYVDAEKIVWRDIAALAALGHIDFSGIVNNHFNRQGVELETDSWGMIPKDRPEFGTPAGMPLWSMEVYYRLLNCGFRIPVSAGSASGVKASPLGYNRVYAKLDEPFNYDTWFQALKAGRSFGTNGPMLFLKVNGAEVGSTLKFKGTGPFKMKIHAEAASAGKLDRLEIIFAGRLIQSKSAPDSRGRLELDIDTEVTKSGWVVARCFEQVGETIRFAHTSPIYVEVGDDPGIVPADAQYFVEWIDREMEFYRKESRFRNPEERAAMLQFFEEAKAVYTRLEKRPLALDRGK